MKKQVIVIAAVSRNGVYGEAGKIPWNLPQDIKHFKEITDGETVVMGRKTWESLPDRYRPLPNRCNIVVSRSEEHIATCLSTSKPVVVSSLKQAIEQAPTEKVFCIGGVSIWYEAMDIANEAWITLVHDHYKITPDVTNVAECLVKPLCYWDMFHLKETVKPVAKGGYVPYFEINHWVR